MKKWTLCEVRVYEELSQLFNSKKFNWIHFCPFGFQFDYDKYGPLLSVSICIAGLGFYISFNPNWETEQSKEIKTILKEVEDGNTIKICSKCFRPLEGEDNENNI